MNNLDFVHLHVHSEHSLLDGLGSPAKYARKVSEMGFEAISVTDHGNVDGHLKWQKACRDAGVKSVLGCELYVVGDAAKKERGEEKYHVVILVKGFEGWKALMKMLTAANLEGFYNKPRIDRKILLENINDEIVVLTGCANSFLLMDGGQELLIELHKNRGIDCYLEVMPHQIQEQVKINELCLGLNRKYDIPLVATNDCHYVQENHSVAQEVLLAVQRQAKWSDPNRWKFKFKGLYLRSADEMIQEFKAQGILSRSQYYGAMANAKVAAETCWNFEIPRREINLPKTKYEKMQPGSTAEEVLDKLCETEWKEKRKNRKNPEDYEAQYLRELAIIKRKGFAPYFLIVYEIVQWCKENKIMVGPGRGSVGGSLVAYLLDITQVDPLRYNLLFERFISEDRIDYPDIDLDFEDVKCSLVRKHLEEEYGEMNVVGISTFFTMKGRGVIRDVGRVFELPIGDVDIFAKSIREGDYEDEIVASVGENTKEGQHFMKKYPEEFLLAEILEGTIRGAGQHAAGLIVSGKNLRGGENCCLCRRSDAVVCNWDMDDCEYNGLIKIDVLKLGTLTVLNETRKLMAQAGKNILYYHPESECWFVDKEGEIGDGLVQQVGEFDYPLLPLDDQKVFQMLSDGNTSGVFQFSGYTVTELCKKMGINSFEDMVAAVSLARPGPAESGMTELYIRRKKGEKWIPLHPVYEAITKETYGVIVYQEQMMKAVTDLAGFSNSDADRIRKVIGKKRKVEEFEPYREAFLKGCREKKTLTEKQADEFWQGLLEWASYGFNKSHAVEYAMIAYWMAWIKLYYQTEFFCAQLTYGMKDGKQDIIREVEKSGMNIVTPKIGLSDARRWISKDKNLYMPFIEIKGIGEGQADKCMAMKLTSLPRRGLQGFFKLEEPEAPEAKTKLEKLLNEVKAFDPALSAGPKDSLAYFQYSIQENGRDEKKTRIEIIRKKIDINFLAHKCEACKLREQADRVVMSSLGMYNVLALGEAPGKDENEKGIGFFGDAGQLLWRELADYGITRRMIHVGNCCKCWPRTDKTPSKKQIDECFNRWMLQEILSMDCRLILATGNVPLYALTGRDSGISSVSGQMEWVEKVRSWVVWCVHPSAVLRNRSSNIGPFQKGIEVFAELFNSKITK